MAKQHLTASDLMVGDWLKNILFNEFEQVDCLEDNNINGHPTDWYEPIPLTPEILEKNRFTSKDDKLYKFFLLCVPTGHEKDSFTIQIILYKKPLCGVTTLFKCWGWIPPLQGGVNDLHICNLVSVHELQHAIKLCGIDKTIEL